MKPTLRRLSAVAAAATTTAVVAGLLVAPSASAAITSITPNTAFNTETKPLTFAFGGSENGDYRFGGTAVLSRLGAPSDSFTVTIDPTPSADGRTGQTRNINFADVGNGLGADGPANAGVYSAVATDRVDSTDADSCTSCFTVLTGTPVDVDALSPNSLRAGQSAEVTITGDGFERGSTIELLISGTQTVDPNINANQAPTTNDQATPTVDERSEGITTRTTLRRTFTVGANATTGARDVRVTNVDGSSSVLPGGFSVNGAPLTSTTPTAGNNDPSLGLTRVTFNGAGLNTAGKPFLQYTADPGSSTREALTIPGTVVATPTATTFTADFDLRNAAPQRYLPVVRNPDGSVNACSCSFTVAQAPTRVTTVTSLDSDTATAGTQKTQAAGTTESFVVNGTGFAKGTQVTVSGAGVTTTGVEFLSATQLKATFQTTAAAAAGDRNVTATRTDGTTSAACTGCYTVTAASPSPSASPSGSPSPSPSQGNVQAPTVNVNPSTITAVEEKATVFGTAQPGSTIEIYAYSRPNTTYRLVRSARVGANGQYSFEVGPSGNTRLYARTVTPLGSADSDSIVLTVRVSINIKVAQLNGQTLRFTGSTLPKRPGQLVTVFYQRTGQNRVIASRARVTEQGTYAVTREFTGTGTFDFFTGTGTDITNAGNTSRKVRLTLR